MSIVIVGLMLTVLFSMAAFGVDLGAAFAERRHDQNTVDAAVMSGAVESVLGGGVVNQVVAEVRDKVEVTLGRSVSAAEWTACKDPDHLELTTKTLAYANPTISPVSECISFNAGFDRLRVRLPGQTTQAVFGPALGFDRLVTAAAAEAEVVPAYGGGAPPFLALEGTTKGDFACLRTGGNQSGEPINLLNGNGPGLPPTPGLRPDPCNSINYPVSSSTFGTVLPWGYERDCRQQDTDTKLGIAIGMDHLLGIFPGGYQPDPITGIDPRQRIDGGSNCTVAFPNTLMVDTGFTASLLRCALVSLKFDDLCENEYPRLRQGGNVQSTHKVVGEALDNVPPWTYLRPASELHAANAPAACVRLAASRTTDPFDLVTNGNGRYALWVVSHPLYADANWDAYDRYDDFDECLDSWPWGGPELFDESIGESPRFAFIPQVAEASLTGPTQLVHIEGFLPVYLFRLYIPSNNSLMCDPIDVRISPTYLVHDAGGSYSCGSTNDNIARVSSIVMACGMLPDVLCDKESNMPSSAGTDIYDFRLAE